MSRRRSRRDGVGDHVAHQLTWEEAGNLVAKVTSRGFVYELSELVELIEQHEPAEMDEDLDHVLGSIRRPDLRSLFEAEQKVSASTGSCRSCGRSLPRPATGTPGRRRAYCSPACKQAAYRRRKGQCRQAFRLTMDTFAAFQLDSQDANSARRVRIDQRTGHGVSQNPYLAANTPPCQNNNNSGWLPWDTTSIKGQTRSTEAKVVTTVGCTVK